MPSRYDVFLSHSSADKTAVEEIARRLRDVGIEPFLDKWHLIPGDPWQEALEEALKQSATCAVFLGPSGMGPWQNEEMRVALDRRTRDRGSRVIPVLLPRARYPKEEEIPSFLARLTWVDFRSGLDDKEAFRRLIAGIRGEAPGPGDGDQPRISNYRSMAIPPEGFVHRREYDRVVEALCSENTNGSTVGITTALRGAGGFGKTALAQAVCQDECVRKKYPDGILWTTMGEEVSESGRLSRLRDLIRWWTEKEPPVFETIDGASAFLRDVIAGKRILLIVDDVWSDLDLSQFQGIASARLITTREKNLLPSGSYRIDVDAMEIPEAVNLLWLGLPEFKVEVFRILARRLGEWPILLKLVNRQLREMVEVDGYTVKDALHEVESTLVLEGLTAFDIDDAESRQFAVEKTLAVSLKRLTDAELLRYHNLAVFPEDVGIPIYILEKFWETSQFETERICRRLDNLSLLLRFDRRTGVLYLHDVFRHYLVYKKGNNLPGLQRRFLEVWRPQSGYWGDISEEKIYIWKYLSYHLLEARKKETLRELLLDNFFIQSKLRKTDVNALIADYDPFVRDEEELRLVQGAIRLSAHILAKHPEQLAPHLLGRLLGGKTTDLKYLLEQCRQASRLRPRTPSFRPPGPLLRTVETDSSVKALAVIDGRRAVSGSSDGTLRVWDLETGQALKLLKGHNSLVRTVVVVDERRAISGSDDGTLRVWDLETGQTLRTLEGHNSSVTAVALVDSQRAISGSYDRTLRIWDLEAGKTLRTLEGHNASVWALAVIEGRRTISGSYDGTLRVWDLETGQTLQTLEGHKDWVTAVAVVDSRHAISGSHDRTLRVWDLETGKTLQTLKGHNDWVMAVAVVDGQRAVSGSHDGTLRVWDLKTGQTLHTLEGHNASVCAVAVVCGQRTISGSADWTLRVWDLETGQTLRAIERHNACVSALAVVDGQRAVSGSNDGTLRIWDLETGQTLQIFNGHTNWVTAVAVMDGRRAVSGSHDWTLRVWDLKTGQTLLTLKEDNTSWVTAVAVVDNQRAISGFDSGKLQIWNLKTGKVLRTFEEYKSGVRAVAVVDGQRAISGFDDRTLRVWNLETGQTLRILEGHNASVRAVAMVDGWRAVSGSEDRTLRVWELETGRVLRTLEGHNASVRAVTVVAGRRAVSGSDDRTLRIWDLETGECLAVLVLEAAVASVAVAPDRRTVVAGDASGRVHFLEFDVDVLN